MAQGPEAPLGQSRGNDLVIASLGYSLVIDAWPDRERVAQTVVIDEFVAKENLRGVNFRKKGGATLRELHPQLTISVYYGFEHLAKNPQAIGRLRRRLYLGHARIHTEETVRFAWRRGPRQLRDGRSLVPTEGGDLHSWMDK